MGIAARACHPRVGLGVGTRLCAGSIVLLPPVGLLRARGVRVRASPVQGRCDTEQRPTGAHGADLSEWARGASRPEGGELWMPE